MFFRPSSEAPDPDKWTVFVLLDDQKHKVEVEILDNSYRVRIYCRGELTDTRFVPSNGVLARKNTLLLGVVNRCSKVSDVHQYYGLVLFVFNQSTCSFMVSYCMTFL